MDQNEIKRWRFEWGSQLVGGLIQSEEEGWILCGRPNSTPATGWLVAHDVFHHLPGDTGTYAEEVATFGAQTLFEMPKGEDATFQNTLATSWFSVMALVLENGTRGVDGLFLDNAPTLSMDHPLSGLWRDAYRLAVREVRDVFGQWAEDETWNALMDPKMEDQAVAWAAYGFEQSKLRWPQIEQARGNFWKIEAMARTGAAGSRLNILQNEDGSIEGFMESPKLNKRIGMR